MSICEFHFAEDAAGVVTATCSQCGRSVRVTNRTVVAACRASADYKQTHASIVASMSARHLGAGDHLHGILRDWLGIEPDEQCACEAMRARMNTLGPDWCEGPGMPEILETMRAEHAKRRADGRTLLPWSDYAARMLVLLACRRARASMPA